MRAKSRPCRAAAALLALMVVAVGAFALEGREGDGPTKSAPGVAIGHLTSDGGITALPGELLGLGGMKLEALDTRKAYTIVGWRFTVAPADARVAYLIRPFPDAADCRGARMSFDTDAVSARESGDQYPCRGFRKPGGATVSRAHGWELVAAVRAPAAGGATVRFANPVVELRGAAGEKREVRADYGQTVCVIGALECARWLERNRFSAKEARDVLRTDCRRPRRTPFFVAAEHRPPRDPRTVRSRDDRGRLCAPVP